MNQVLPGLGVGAYILRNHKLLMGYRTTGHAAGVWAPPGGHVELGETPGQTASREAYEETGLRIPPHQWKLRAVTSDYFAANHTHYITLVMLASCLHGEPIVREPHKQRGWEWLGPGNMPEHLMPSVSNAFAAGFDPFLLNQEIITNF